MALRQYIAVLERRWRAAVTLQTQKLKVAVKLQACVRCWILRKKFVLIRRAVVKLQGMVRGWMARHHWQLRATSVDTESGEAVVPAAGGSREAETTASFPLPPMTNEMVAPAERVASEGSTSIGSITSLLLQVPTSVDALVEAHASTTIAFTEPTAVEPEAAPQTLQDLVAVHDRSPAPLPRPATSTGAVMKVGAEELTPAGSASSATGLWEEGDVIEREGLGRQPHSQETAELLVMEAAPGQEPVAALGSVMGLDNPRVATVDSTETATASPVVVGKSASNKKSKAPVQVAGGSLGAEAATTFHTHRMGEMAASTMPTTASTQDFTKVEAGVEVLEAPSSVGLPYQAAVRPVPVKVPDPKDGRAVNERAIIAAAKMQEGGSGNALHKTEGAEPKRAGPEDRAEACAVDLRRRARLSPSTVEVETEADLSFSDWADGIPTRVRSPTDAVTAGPSFRVMVGALRAQTARPSSPWKAFDPEVVDTSQAYVDVDESKTRTITPAGSASSATGLWEEGDVVE